MSNNEFLISILNTLFDSNNSKSLKEVLEIIGNESNSNCVYISLNNNTFIPKSDLLYLENIGMIDKFKSFPLIDENDCVIGKLFISSPNNIEEKINISIPYITKAISFITDYNKISSSTMFDELTGVKNSNAYIFDSSKINANTLGLIFIDIDGLHDINNNNGHLAGDLVIKSVSDGLKRKFRKEEIYRIGGDEFIILVPFVEEEELKRRIDDVYTNLKNNGVNISYGISYKTDTDIDINSMKSDADNRMFEMKFAKPFRRERK